MGSTQFIQIHTLTSYPGALLNRDDAGFAKRMPFGGASRTRISSQCLKYHWRNHIGVDGLNHLKVPRSVRSRQTFQRLVAKPLITEGHNPALVACAVSALQALILTGKLPSEGDYKKLLEESEGSLNGLNTSQVTILGEPEVRYLRERAASILDQLREDLGAVSADLGAQLSGAQLKTVVDSLKKVTGSDLKKNLHGLGIATGLDAAMFGRMATSDFLSRGDSAVHVAHAFTTHAEESESDYFSAVDELLATGEEGELGSGHINMSELSSGLFYGYVVIDVPLLVSNLEGCKREEWQGANREVAEGVVARLIHLIATVSPGAKLGSTAPYSRSECVLIEVGAAQPRTLANAFRKPVEKVPDLLANTYHAMASHVRDLDRMYGTGEERRLSATGDTKILTAALQIEADAPLSETASWAASQVRG